MITAFILIGLLATSQKNIEGEWLCVQPESFVGQPVRDPKSRFPGIDKYIFKGDQWKSFKNGKINSEGTYTTEAVDTKNYLDLTTKKRFIGDKNIATKDSLNECVYEIDGNFLDIVIAMPDKPRPVSTNPPDYKEAKYILVRLKKATKE